MKLKSIFLSFSTIATTAILAGCAGGYEPVPNMAKIDAKFADKSWNGEKIPKGQQCQLFSGKGATPKMMVSNLPAGTNAIIMEVNDLNYAPLSTNGGHGKIGFWIKEGSTSVTLVPVPGHTSKNLPEGTFIERASMSKGRYATSGYLPPCSGGRNHMYTATIKAVYKAKKDDEKSKLLGETSLNLGRY